MGTMAVTEPKPGTMTNVAGQAKVTPETEVKTPAGEKVSPEEKVYTESQLQALLHATQSEAGRKVKAAEAEATKYKNALEAKETELTDNAAEIDKLQAKFDDMAKDDPAKVEVAKELKAAREERKQLKADRTALDAEKQELAPARETKKEIDLFNLIVGIAKEYDATSYNQVWDICQTIGTPTEEQVRKIADTFWTKKAGGEPPKPKAPAAYPGNPSGGGSDSLESLRKKDTRFMNQKQLAEHKSKLLEALKAQR